MIQLAQAGIPQGNVYEFAAQMVLKYEKNLRKKHKNIEEVNQFNQNVIKMSPHKNNSNQSQSTSKVTRNPQLLPFKK